ncbi:helix-turn-helix domain-containing protein [Clostridium sp.]|uniref:helix-turn-helix domain-containing protein n=1 Tax=Clostridium sp. TaxID=1506 RepID=UPI002915C430|nr:helix-turn-helix transcriptional regulator [Clostridium sp.]
MLGDNIRKIRKEKKISINNLSKLTGISLGYLSDLENNKATNPSIDKLNLIASKLGVPVDSFFDRNPILNKNINIDTIFAGPGKLAPNLDDYEFKTPEAAMKFILKQPAIMGYGGFDVEKLSDEELIDFANELLNQMKLISYKYKK